MLLIAIFVSVQMHANIETCTPFLVIRVADTGIQLSYFTTFFVRKDWIPVSSTGMTPFGVNSLLLYGYTTLPLS
ncbi:hypothetical protein [Wolbachia endosymbiont of Laodelphax striatellus]|uniref:hypothetical protein n=1 Tax=Wolbachia endosymbiont of Laodelphax striatellus TaxID=368602 RepID=UPI000A7EB037|nr:hypothetical protein [Wolbachia endosymbiont of Laodelphax striatellus]